MHSYTDTPVLVTGGTGSFGTTLIDHLLSRGCPEIRVLSRDETKQDAMRNRLGGNSAVRFFLGDVRSRASVDRAMSGVHLVFHAAALKQVPSCEFFPLEAVATNVLGSSNVVESAVAHEVGSVVLLGTDKAVYPINTMGMTKALMEKIGQAEARALLRDGRPTKICMTRYGNVLCSRGSVVPRFIEQIKRGERLTITEPTMTRFLLLLTAAVDLVELAWDCGENGDVFVRKAPACTVEDLAQAIQNIFGRDVGTKRIGVRHGEKLHETLATQAELRRAEDLGDYFRIRMDEGDLDYASYFSEGDPNDAPFEDYSSNNTKQLGVSEVESLLLGLPQIQAALAS